MGQMALLEEVKKGASISPCGRYRWYLTREWDSQKEKVVFIMLNPSTADAYEDDPTIRRCIGFAKAWGYGGFIVLNLFALRSTDPKALYTANDPIGTENDNWIGHLCAGRVVVCAWGCHGKLNGRDQQVKRLLGNKGLRCMGTTKEGHPKHPLYLRSDILPVHFGLT